MSVVLPLLKAAAAARAGEGPVPLFLLRAGVGEAAWLAEQIGARGEPVFHADASRIPAGETGRERAQFWLRTAAVDDAMLIVSGIDTLAPRERAEVARFLAQGSADIVLLVIQTGAGQGSAGRGGATGQGSAGQGSDGQASDGTLDLGHHAPGGVRLLEPATPSRSARAAIWQDMAAEAGLPLAPAVARQLGSTYGFEREQIEATVALAVAGRGGSDPLPALRTAARQVARGAVPAHVRWIETVLCWDDLVLPDPVKRELHAIADHIQKGAQVWDDWGFGRRTPYGQGVAALFAGPSGTGKTMAAQIIAGEMGVPLFHVDLAQTVSKFIGETEKALAGIFKAAACAGAVLLFDEADALFGKRSEVKDAHDRYANIEVAYLLQQMEEYSGLAILTTNAKQNVDAAFLRRLRFVVDFPLPEPRERLAIWQSMVPTGAPLAEDVDLEFLARQLPLSGGNIQQIVLRAAFDAVEDGAIGMAHILAATRRELTKLGLQSTERFIAQVVSPPPRTGTVA